MTINSINSVNSAQSLRQADFDSQDKPIPRAQKPAFGMIQDSYEGSGSYAVKRVLTNGAVGAIIGAGFELLRGGKGLNLLKSAGGNAIFLIVFSELFDLVARPISKTVDKFSN